MKLEDFFLVPVCNLQFHRGLSSKNSTSSHTKPCNLQTSRLLNNPREFNQPTVRFNHKLRAHLSRFFRLPWAAMCVLWQRWHSLHDILINWKFLQKQFFSGDYGVECDFLWNYTVGNFLRYAHLSASTKNSESELPCDNAHFWMIHIGRHRNDERWRENPARTLIKFRIDNDAVCSAAFDWTENADDLNWIVEINRPRCRHLFNIYFAHLILHC